MRPAGDDADVLADIGELRREQAANRASTNYAYPHQSKPFQRSSLTSAVTPGHIWRVNAASQMALSTLTGA
jgi:hypothetical protein